MIIFKKSAQLNEYILSQKNRSSKIGFVPTMGALHNGHLSLLESSHANNEVTVCSIFINPTQFNNPDDLRKYPVTLEQDILLLHQAKADIIFIPAVEEIYPGGTMNLPPYELGNLENILEGKFRPGHFQGVCQVMNRLLDIVQPDNLYMGQKDYQQCMIVERLLKIMQAGVALNTCGTLREPDGLAMSSRNARLNTTERKNAVAIFKVLNCFRQKLQTGNLKDLLENGKSLLVQHGFKPDYIEIRDAKTLESLSFWDGKQQLVALVAASMNQVRLIDNMIVTV